MILVFLASLTAGVLGVVNISGINLYYHDLILGFICLYLAGRKYKLIKNAGFVRTVIPFAVISLISLFINTGHLPLSELFQSSLYLVRFLLYFTVYLTVVCLPLESGWWLGGLLASGLIFTLFGYLQYLFFPDLRFLTILGWDPHYYRLTSTFLDPNFAGLYIVLIILLAFNMLGKNLRLFIPVMVFLLGALYLTHSRSGYLAFIGAVTVWVVISKNLKIFIGLLLLVMLLLFIPKGRLDVTDLFRTETTYARLNNWMVTAEFIRKSPIFGFGFNTLKFTAPLAGSTVNNVPSHSSGGIDSSLMVVLATTGVSGLISYLWIFYSAVKLSIREIKLKKSGGMGVLFVCSAAAVFVHSLFNNSLFYPWIMIFLWILIGVIEKETVQKQI
jgi:O-antigen ligase